MGYCTNKLRVTSLSSTEGFYLIKNANIDGDHQTKNICVSSKNIFSVYYLSVRAIISMPTLLCFMFETLVRCGSSQVSLHLLFLIIRLDHTKEEFSIQLIIPSGFFPNALPVAIFWLLEDTIQLAGGYY